MSLETLLHNLPIVDLLHCDIQFAESRAFSAGIAHVTRKVRRVVIGTHSRRIEDELIEVFRSRSWMIEYETPCKYVIENGVPTLNADGVQVRRNSELPDDRSPSVMAIKKTHPFAKIWRLLS